MTTRRPDDWVRGLEYGPWGPYRDLPAVEPPPPPAPPTPVPFIERPPVIPPPSGEQPDPSSPRVRRLRGAGIVVVVLAVALWLAGWASWLNAAPQPQASPAMSFVPADGTYRDIAVNDAGSRQVGGVESTRAADLEIVLSVPLTALPHLRDPQAAEGSFWWVERVGAGRQRNRVRQLKDGEVRLLSQSGGPLDVAFFPYLLELPADLAAGKEWKSQGTGQAVTSGPDAAIAWYNESRADRPVDDKDAARGCLTITSSTGISNVSKVVSIYQEKNLWCPDVGIVATTSSFHGKAFNYEPTDKHGPAPQALATTSASGTTGWTAQEASPVSEGSVLFPTMKNSSLAGPVTETAFGPVVTTLSGSVASIHAAGPQSRLAWFARPGGTTLSSAAIGNGLVVTTTQRDVIFYRANGTRAWSVRLTDVAQTPPVMVGSDRVAVATLAGEVRILNLRDGATVWSQQASDVGIATIVANERYVGIIDTEPTVAVLDATSGEKLWDIEYKRSVRNMSIVDAAVLVSDGESLVRYEAAAGNVVWQRSGLSRASAAAADQEVVVVNTPQGLRLFESASGRDIATIPGVRDVAAMRDGYAILVGNKLIVRRGTVELAGWTVGEKVQSISLGPTSIAAWESRSGPVVVVQP